MKSFYSAVISVFLIMLTIFVCKNYVEIKENERLENIISFQIEQDGNMETIHLWKNDEGKGFVFLPSYAEPRNMHISLEKSVGSKIYLDGREFTNGDSLEFVEFEKEYSLSANDETYPVKFLKSANVAAMYVETKPEEIDRIYANKNNKTEAVVALYTSDGYCNYLGSNDSIKCRGNGTFGLEKKPFAINLEKPNNLLEMGDAQKWILLANANDTTNLKNKMVFDFAKSTKLEWTPESEYVDLYINGDYNGLYLLCEKIEIEKTRLDIGENDGFICKNEPSWRFDQLQNPFITSFGRATEITAPDTVTTSQMRKIKSDVNLMEKEMEDGTLTHIDIDSWASKYLIDEITENTDADFCSSYFYCRYVDGEPRFYGGPIWDYDLIFGSLSHIANPCTFFANRRLKTRENPMPYYYTLYNNEKFYDRVVEIYSKELLPKLTQLVAVDIKRQEEFIKEASYQNKVRWYREDTDCSSGKIREYLKKRIEFLSEAWIEKREYCIVQIETGIDEVFLSYAVPKGEPVSACPEFQGFEKGNNVYIDSYDNHVFDFDEPVFEDKEIFISSNSLYKRVLIQARRYVKEYILCGVLTVFVIVLLILGYCVLKRGKRYGK
ncbi:MAG: CotH kinase family protein [Clostridia bacterium]|nr:CotH kinase family protein [Clostridia bacterium]